MAEETRTTDDRRREELEASTARWMLVGLILMGLFVLAFPLFRFYEPGERADARSAQEEHLAAVGGSIFSANCASCHGAEGSGAIAPAIGTLGFLISVDDTQIAQLIAVGVPGSEMVAYSLDYGGPLTSEQIEAVTVYLRSLEEDAVDMENWRTPLDDDGLTGQELYVLACSRCHGIDLEGDEELGYPDISASSVTQLEGDEWIAGRITDGYKQMPRFGRVLTGAQIASIVQYMRFGTGAPPVTTTTVPDGGVTTTTEGDRSPETDDVLALGEELFQRRAGGRGCQECHGTDGAGTVNGPNILGASRSVITTGLGGGVPDMDFQPRLTSDEIEAVYQYLVWLVSQG